VTTLDLTPNDWQRANLAPLAVACPDCGSPAGQLCTSHGGTRARNSQVHRARTAAWETARLAANPAAKLIADAVTERGIRHGQHAVNLLREHGYTAEADNVQRAVSRRHGHMSAKQAAQFLIDIEGGENQ